MKIHPLGLASRIPSLLVASALVAPLSARAVTMEKAAPPPMMRYPQVNIPGEPRFDPFVITIYAGQSVRWVNTAVEDHNVTSDDTFNYAIHRGLDKVVPGTASNHGQPGYVEVKFPQPGLFVYYDKEFARLDANSQPTAPGPLGGIQDAAGDYGTPMMGVVWVLPAPPASTAAAQ
ncbi:MAG: hypothetical protein U0610_26050 [bacterium]